VVLVWAVEVVVLAARVVVSVCLVAAAYTRLCVAGLKNASSDHM